MEATSPTSELGLTFIDQAVDKAIDDFRNMSGLQHSRGYSQEEQEEQEEREKLIVKAHRDFKKFIKRKNDPAWIKAKEDFGLCRQMERWIERGLAMHGVRTWNKVFSDDIPIKNRMSQAKLWVALWSEFEQTNYSFIDWLKEIYPKCPQQDSLRAMRMLWIAIFLSAEVVKVKPDVKIDSTRTNSEVEAKVGNEVFALCLLYPLIDDFLDRPTERASSDDALATLKKVIFVDVSDKSHEPESTGPLADERLLLIGRLVPAIKGELNKNGTSKELFMEMASRLVEREVILNPEDSLKHAAYKGAYTIFMLYIIIFGKVYPGEAEWLAKLGLALQVIDDWQDWEEDKKIGTQTPVLEALESKSLHGLEPEKLYRRTYNFIKMEICRASTGDGLGLTATPKALISPAMRQMLSQSMYMLLFEAVAKYDLDLKRLVQSGLPIRYQFVSSVSLEKKIYDLINSTHQLNYTAGVSATPNTAPA